MTGRINGGGGKVSQLAAKFESQSTTAPTSRPSPQGTSGSGKPPVPAKPQGLTATPTSGGPPPVPAKPSRLSEDLAPKPNMTSHDGFGAPPKKTSTPTTPTTTAQTPSAPAPSSPSTSAPATVAPQSSSGSAHSLPEGFQPPATPLKHDRRTVIGTKIFNPPKADAPGSRYNDINPMQQHVSGKIVQQKIDGWKQNPPAQPPVVPVYMAPNTQKLTIAGDGHHTFVAALKSGQPMELQLVKMPGAGMPATHTSWQNCTYADFAKGDKWQG